MKLSFLKIESYKRGIVFSTAFNFISRLLLFLQSVAIAYYFGTQDKTDIFFYCFTTVTLIAYFINSLDSSVLIPEAMRLREQENERESIKFLNFFIYIYFFIGLLSTVVLLLFPVDILHLISKFEIPVLENNLQIVLLAIPLFGFMITTNLLVNILASYKFFTVPMMVSTINNGSALICLLVFHDSLGIISLLFGQLAAYTLNIIFLGYLMKKNLHWFFSFQRIKIGKRIVNNVLFAQLGNVTSTLSTYLPMYILSGWGAGVISSLIYGQKTAEIPNQLISTQASAVVGIKLNESFAKNDAETFNRVFLSVTNLLIFILIPISFILFMFSENIIMILYKRGAFNSASVETTTQFFKYFVLILPMLAINATVARVFMAGQKIIQSVIYQIFTNCLLIVMIYTGIQHMGITGYPIVLIVYHILNIVMCYFLLRRFFYNIQFLKILTFFIKALLLNSIICLFVKHLVNPWLSDINVILGMIISLSVYLLLLFTANMLLKLNNEVNDIVNRAFYLVKTNLQL